MHFNPAAAVHDEGVPSMREKEPAPMPSMRVSALAFTEGIRGGWLAGDLMVWANNHLFTPGRLRGCWPDAGGLTKVHELGFGVVMLGEAARVSGRKHGRRTASGCGSLPLPALLAASRDRVVGQLRRAMQSGENSFVNAALYAGRVARERALQGRSVWQVWLSEDDMLSDQVLALFAADALTYPDDYQHNLVVCDACGAVSFGQAISRQRCPVHPFGRNSGVMPQVG